MFTLWLLQNNWEIMNTPVIAELQIMKHSIFTKKKLRNILHAFRQYARLPEILQNLHYSNIPI